MPPLHPRGCVVWFSPLVLVSRPLGDASFCFSQMAPTRRQNVIFIVIIALNVRADL